MTYFGIYKNYKKNKNVCVYILFGFFTVYGLYSLRTLCCLWSLRK